MVEGKKRSRSLRRVHKTLPGGRRTTHYEPRKPKAPHCSECKAVLHGIPRGTATQMKNMPKTHKRPERPYGGMLCSKCARKHIIQTIQK